MTPVASLPTRRLRQLRLDTEPARRSLHRNRAVAATAAVHRRQQATLEQIARSSVWEGLLAVGAADCLVCGAQMERRGAAGECGGCGTTIS